jgi:hypothetical protein
VDLCWPLLGRYIEQVGYVSNGRRKDECFLKFQVLPKTNNAQALQKSCGFRMSGFCSDSGVSFTHVQSSSQLTIKQSDW